MYEHRGPEGEAARRIWRSAKSHAELCELGARFLEGDLLGFPGWMAEDVDEETDPLAGILGACCRGGYLTVASQPAGPERAGADGRPERRRAFVTGFASPAALVLLSTLRERGLELYHHPALHEHPDPGVVVGERGGEPFLFAGGASGPAELELFVPHVARAGVESLAATRLASLVDPEWQRDDRLWPALAQAFASE